MKIRKSIFLLTTSILCVFGFLNQASSNPESASEEKELLRNSPPPSPRPSSSKRPDQGNQSFPDENLPLLCPHSRDVLKHILKFVPNQNLPKALGAHPKIAQLDTEEFWDTKKVYASNSKDFATRFAARYGEYLNVNRFLEDIGLSSKEDFTQGRQTTYNRARNLWVTHNLDQVIENVKNVRTICLIRTPEERIEFQSWNFAYANLSGINLKDAYLRNADFTRANIGNADFTRTGLEGANLQSVDRAGAKFKDAYLTDTYLEPEFYWIKKGIYASSSQDFLNTFAEKYELTLNTQSLIRKIGERVKNSSLFEAQFQAMKLWEKHHLGITITNLSKIRRWGQASPDSRHLVYANLTGANISRYHMGAYDLKGANLTRVTAKFTDFYAANLEDAVLIRANLLLSNLQKASLKNAILFGAKFAYADIRNANFRGAKIYLEERDCLNSTKRRGYINNTPYPLGHCYPPWNYKEETVDLNTLHYVSQNDEDKKPVRSKAFWEERRVFAKDSKEFVEQFKARYGKYLNVRYFLKVIGLTAKTKDKQGLTQTLRKAKQLWIIHKLDRALEDIKAVKAALAGGFGRHFTGYHLAYANFDNANFHNARMDKSDLFGASFRHANLQSTSLILANLRRANLRGAQIEATNFTGADLREANLDSLEFMDPPNFKFSLISAEGMGKETLKSKLLKKALWKKKHLKESNIKRVKSKLQKLYPDPR